MEHPEEPRGEGAESPITLTPTELRQGVAPNVARQVLAWGVSLTVLAFLLIYIFAQ